MKLTQQSLPARAARLLLFVGLLVGCSATEPSASRSENPPASRNENSQQAAAAAATTPTPDKKWFADSLKSPVIENAKYALQCIFKITEMKGAEGSPAIKYVESVSIKDVSTGEDAVYAPAGEDDSLSSSQGYFAEVWSPDGEYLVLPLSPFEGFCIIKAKGALKTIKERRCDDFIRVLHHRPSMDVKQVAYYHEWDGWATGNAIRFKAGLHNDRETFIYDVATKELYDGETRNADFLSYLKERVAKNDIRDIGESKRGRVEITKSFQSINR